MSHLELLVANLEISQIHPIISHIPSSPLDAHRPTLNGESHEATLVDVNPIVLPNLT